MENVIYDLKASRVIFKQEETGEVITEQVKAKLREINQGLRDLGNMDFQICTEIDGEDYTMLSLVYEDKLDCLSYIMARRNKVDYEIESPTRIKNANEILAKLNDNLAYINGNGYLVFNSEITGDIEKGYRDIVTLEVLTGFEIENSTVIKALEEETTSEYLKECLI